MTVWRTTALAREWQLRAHNLWSREMRGIFGVVTGAGKTIFAQMCMITFRERVPDGSMVILVPTVALLDQWIVSLREDLNVPEDEIAAYYGEDRPTEPRMVNVVVINTGREVAPMIAKARETFLIVDECHRAASPVNALALGGHHRATLGLSATPEREYDTGLDDVLIPSLGEVLMRYTYADALADGVIVPFKLINVSLPLTQQEEAKYKGATRAVARLIGRVKEGERAEDQLKRALRRRAAISADAAMRVPAAIRLVEEEPAARTIVFHERIASANRILQGLRAKSISATIYHSGIGPNIRRDNLRLYRRGIYDSLVTCRALDEGTNVPETSVAVIASSTATIRQRIQRLGRVLRPAPGKSQALIYTLYATDVEEERLAREVETLPDAASIEWQRVRLNSWQNS